MGGHTIFDEESNMARIITVTSGKGGVGRTTISANLAIGLAVQGFRICLFDADLGLADINILFGIYPEHDLEDVVFNHMSLGDILIHDTTGIDIVPGSSRNEKMADLAPENIDYIIRCLSGLADAYDFIIIDSAPGISREVVSFCTASSDIILILTPETTSFIDSYGLLKVLRSNGYDGSIWVAFNRVSRTSNARILFTKFKKTIQDFLTVQIEPLGSIVQDSNVLKALKQQKPYVSLYPNSLVSTCTMNMAQLLVTNGACSEKSFTPLGLRIRSIDIFKKKLHCLSTGWKSAKQKVFSRAERNEKKPVHEYSSASEMQPSKMSFALSCEASVADPKIITEEWRDQSETCVPIKDASMCEATLIPLDFEAFVEKRGNI